MTVSAVLHIEYRFVLEVIVKVAPGRYDVPVQPVGWVKPEVVHQPRKTKPLKVKFELPRTVTVDPDAYGDFESVGGVPVAVSNSSLVLVL